MVRRVLWGHAPGDQAACDLSPCNDLGKKPSGLDVPLDIVSVVDPVVKQQFAPASFSSERHSAAAASAALDEEFLLAEARRQQRRVISPLGGVNYFFGDNPSYPVRQCMSMIIESLSMPNLQRHLQKLLSEARASNLKGQQIFCSSGSLKVVPGRCRLIETIESAATTKSGIGKSFQAATWKTVARCLQEEVVLQQFSMVEELLALPHDDYVRAVLRAANDGDSHSRYVPPAWRLQ